MRGTFSPILFINSILIIVLLGSAVRREAWLALDGGQELKRGKEGEGGKANMNLFIHTHIYIYICIHM